MPGRRTGGSARKLAKLDRAGPAFFFEGGDDLLQRGKVGVPVVQQAVDAVGRAQLAAARRFEIDDIVIENNGGERGAALFGESAELERRAVHGFFASV